MYVSTHTLKASERLRHSPRTHTYSRIASTATVIDGKTETHRTNTFGRDGERRGNRIEYITPTKAANGNRGQQQQQSETIHIDMCVWSPWYCKKPSQKNSFFLFWPKWWKEDEKTTTTQQHIYYVCWSNSSSRAIKSYYDTTNDTNTHSHTGEKYRKKKFILQKQQKWNSKKKKPNLIKNKRGNISFQKHSVCVYCREIYHCRVCVCVSFYYFGIGVFDIENAKIDIQTHLKLWNFSTVANKWTENEAKQSKKQKKNTHTKRNAKRKEIRSKLNQTICIVC